MKLAHKTLFLVVATVPWILSATAQTGGLGKLHLPNPGFKYADADMAYPRYYTDPTAPLSVRVHDNTPANNPITNNGATLGRVLFYDKRLSVNFTVSCGSCHVQSHGFSDPARFSRGVNGTTTRHSMGLSDSRYYQNGRFFWDERAPTLEFQVLQPIQNEVEMGLPLDQAVARVQAASFYRPLFIAAFGDATVTSDRMARAMAQFVRSIVTYKSKFDAAFDTAGNPRFQETLTPQEFLGLRLFQPVPGLPNIARGCNRCHVGAAQISTQARNNGLDLNTPGGGRFKSPSLRNIAVRGPYMHDGRFATLRDVIEFYDHGVQNNPFLDPILRDPVTGLPRRLNMTPQEKDAMEAFMRTLTDQSNLTDPRFSDPFVLPFPIDPTPVL